jgi:serine/threonine protein kinase
MPSIGKYEILEQLGSGSMGTVHKGRDKLLDRMVALKMIRTGVNIELEAKERFYREARTCARLSHPHIVSVYDLGEENGTSFIAMELLKGADFRQLIERKEPLPLPVKLIAMAQICEGLAHAHREGVIHRDIKPSNLFLLADGRAKIVDFGIAKLPTSHLTRSGAVLGTPNYMAPEQIQGHACDGRADLFSAGICFFEFLTYHHPFQGNLIPQRILEDKPDSLFQWDPSLPRILERIFTKALAKRPEDRYATGDEFAADLRTVVDAVALNSSPTFTSVELPSASSFAVPPPIPATEAAAPRMPSSSVSPSSSGTASGFGTSPGADWRANRIQQLLPILDGQLGHRDIVGARSSLAELQSVVGMDPRFRDALDHYRARVTELDGAPAPSFSQTASQTALAVRCPKCGAANQPNTAFCITCGAAVASGPQAPLTAAPPPPMAVPMLPPPPLVKNAAPPKPISNKPPATGFTADKKRFVLVAAFVVVVVAALFFIVPSFFRTVKAQPFVATARVTSQQGVLHAYASAGGKSIASVSRGTLVNVLALPQSLTSGFAQVQARDNDSFTKPGYISTVELIEWESKDPKMALALARLSGPMDAGTDAELRAQIDKLNSVAATFGGKPEAGAASLDALKLQFALIKRTKDANPTSTDWQTSLSDLSSRLETLRSDPVVQGSADDMLKQVHDLMGTAPQQAAVANGQTPAVTTPIGQPTAGPPANGQPAAPTGPPTPDDIKKWLQSAEYLRKTYDYKNAMFFVQKVLKADPANTDAKKLQEKIKAAIDLENSAK